MAAMTKAARATAAGGAPGSGATPASLDPDAIALLDRVAGAIVERRLEVPAVLALESAMPLSLVAGQTLLFLEPFLAAILPAGDLRRFAKLIERREAVAALIERIESRADAAHRERREVSRARREASRRERDSRRGPGASE